MNRAHADARPGSGLAATPMLGLQLPRAGDAALASPAPVGPRAGLILPERLAESLAESQGRAARATTAIAWTVYRGLSFNLARGELTRHGSASTEEASGKPSSLRPSWSSPDPGHA